MKKFLALFSLSLLCSCKPPKFDQSVTCGDFSADHVYVYTFSDAIVGSRVVVIWPDRSYRIFIGQSCTISGKNDK